MTDILLCDYSLLTKCGYNQFCWNISGTPCHSQKTAVNNINTCITCRQSICQCQSQVIMSVKSNWNMYFFFHRNNIFSCLFRLHKSGRIHDRDFIYSHIFQYLSLFCKFLRR